MDTTKTTGKQYRSMIYMRVFGEPSTRVFVSAWFTSRQRCAAVTERRIQIMRRANEKKHIMLASYEYKIFSRTVR